MTSPPTATADAGQLPAMSDDGHQLRPLHTFIVKLTQLIDRTSDEGEIVEGGTILLRDLIDRDDWLPEALATPQADHYLQNLLHCDVYGRFSVVASVWGPGQSTPPHNHKMWGLVGILRGGEIVRSVTKAADGKLVLGEPRRLDVGDIEMVSESAGDTHVVANAHADRTSISIHVYGGNIGLIDRQILRDGDADQPFRSGYSNASLPNIWLAGL